MAHKNRLLNDTTYDPAEYVLCFFLCVKKCKFENHVRVSSKSIISSQNRLTFYVINTTYFTDYIPHHYFSVDLGLDNIVSLRKRMN